MNHTEKQVRDFLTKNLNENTIGTYIEMLSLTTPVFTRIMDLLAEYRVSILDVKNSVVPMTDENMLSFIESYESQFSAYRPVPSSPVDGLLYMMDTMQMDVLIQQGVDASVSFVKRDIDSLTARIAVKRPESVKSYVDLDTFKGVFSSDVLPGLLLKLGCTSSLTECFPKEDADIAALFSSVSSTYERGGQTYQTKDLAVRIYKEIFSPFFSYLDADNLVFLLYRINDRMSRLEISKGASSMILNYLVPNETVKSLVNREAMAIESRGSLPDDAYMKEVESRVHVTRFDRNLSDSLTLFTFVDSFCKKYYEQSNNMEGYNSDMKTVLDAIASRVDDFKTLIIYSYELSVQYLVV